MRNILILTFLLIVFSSCVSTRSSGEPELPMVDVAVKQWMSTHKMTSIERLPVIVKSKKALGGYSFLRLVKSNFYGGHATFSQVQRLIKDPNILRVYAGKQKLHK